MRKAIVLKEERPLGFYQSLQLDPIILKQKIKETKTKKEKRRWLASLISRSCLIVAFDLYCHGDIWYRSKGGGCRIFLYAVEPTVC